MIATPHGVQNSAYSLPAAKSCRGHNGSVCGHRGRWFHRGEYRRRTSAAKSDRDGRRQFFDGKRENIKAFKDRIEIIDADLATTPNLSQLLNGVEYVIHQAAIPSVPKSIIDPIRSHEANVNGTLRLLLA